MNACIYCKYCEDGEYGTIAKCHCPEITHNRDIITGRLYCEDARGSEEACSNEGKYFKEKFIIINVSIDPFIKGTLTVIAAFVIFIFLITLAFGKDITITSTGYGNTQDEALLDSFYHAVQNANGVHVSSVIELRNGNLTKEEIITQSKGFIKGYSILVPYDGSSITTKIIFGDEKQQVPLEQRVKNTFTIGSSYDEVKKAHGVPKKVTDYTYVIYWYYDEGTIEFRDNKVAGYQHSVRGRLNVR